MAVDLRDGDDADRVDGEGTVEARDIRKAHGQVLYRQAAGWQGTFEQLLADAVKGGGGRPDHAVARDEADVGDRGLRCLALPGCQQRVVIAGALGLLPVVDLGEGTDMLQVSEWPHVRDRP